MKWQDHVATYAVNLAVGLTLIAVAPFVNRLMSPLIHSKNSHEEESNRERNDAAVGTMSVSNDNSVADLSGRISEFTRTLGTCDGAGHAELLCPDSKSVILTVVDGFVRSHTDDRATKAAHVAALCSKYDQVDVKTVGPPIILGQRQARVRYRQTFQGSRDGTQIYGDTQMKELLWERRDSGWCVVYEGPADNSSAVLGE